MTRNLLAVLALQTFDCCYCCSHASFSSQKSCSFSSRVERRLVLQEVTLYHLVPRLLLANIQNLCHWYSSYVEVYVFF
uniref:Putative secreted protein n=1 Tax=Ixodes ricinus TaxID=34613 RepID=A0A6B0U0K4_IXORI